MSNSIFVKQLEKVFIPEVKVTSEVNVNISTKDFQNLMLSVVDKYNLKVVSKSFNHFKTIYEGSPVVHLSQMKVILGLKPELKYYAQLQSYLTVTLVKNDCLLIESSERIILGTKSEQKIYKEVLNDRLQEFESLLLKEINCQE